MIQMPRDDYELFTMLVTSNKQKLQKILFKILKRHYKNIINTGDYLIAEGDIPIALIAHMDTVFKIPPLEKDIFYDREKGVLWSPDGLGADDRAGVFLIVKIIQSAQKGKLPHIIFTQDEEVGGVGASQLCEDFPKPPWPMKYMIQLDRRGKFDCVFYDDSNAVFAQYVESFGFKENIGSFSDISFLSPVWEVSGVNLSVGYEDEHLEIETLHIQYLYMTLQKVKNMLANVDGADYFKFEGYFSNPFRSSFHFWDYYPYEDDDEELSKRWDNTSTACHSCGKTITKSVSIRAKNDYGNFHYYCQDCAAEKVQWCSNCGCAFVSSVPHQELCCDCSDRLWETVNSDEIR